MSTELILPTQKHGLSQNVVKQIPRLMPLLHPGVHPNQWWAAAVIAVNKLNPDVNEASVLISLANLAQTGLMLGDAMGHAYLVPYKGKCTVQFGYRGFLELAYGNSFVKGVAVDWVLDGEDTKLRHTERGKRFRHDMTIESRAIPSQENIVAAYCTYETKLGFCDVVLVPRAELRGLMQKSQDSSPWRSNFAAMALKTPIRRAAKLWRLTKELAIAVELDEQAERDERQGTPPGLDTPTPRITDGVVRTLEATLTGMAKCQTEADMQDVCRYVLRDSEQDHAAFEWSGINNELAAEIMTRLQKSTTGPDAMPWSAILANATPLTH